MTIQRTPLNLAKDAVRQAWPKRQPRRPRPPKEFPAGVRAIIDARSGGMCEVGADCGPAVQYHHRAPRGRGGSSLPWVNKAANCLHVCLDHHDFIEQHRTLALVEGWLVARNGTAVAVDVPVLRRGKSVLLGDDGSIRPVGGAA